MTSRGLFLLTAESLKVAQPLPGGLAAFFCGYIEQYARLPAVLRQNVSPQKQIGEGHGCRKVSLALGLPQPADTFFAIPGHALAVQILLSRGQILGAAGFGRERGG